MSCLKERKEIMAIWTMDMDPGVIFGVDSRKRTGQKLKEYGATKVVFIYDAVMGSLGHAAEMEEIIRQAGLAVIPYEAEVGEPTYAMVNRLADFVMEQQADGIVGLGGGATMDTAKFAGRVIANGGRAEDYLGYTKSQNDLTYKTFRSIIVLPTTAGTGAEVNTAVSCITPEGKKANGRHRATLAIIDPVYTYGLPKSITANTGIDALAHAAESLCNSRAMPNPMADLIEKEAVKLVFQWLPIAYEHGDNKEAREKMCFAAMLGGYAIKLRKTTFGHAIGHRFADRYHWPHGFNCSLGLAALVRYNVTGDPESTRILAECCGVDCPPDADMTEVGKKVVEKFDALLKGVGMKNMKELGVEEEFCDFIKEDVSKDTKWTIVPNPPDFELMGKALHESYDY